MRRTDGIVGRVLCLLFTLSLLGTGRPIAVGGRVERQPLQEQAPPVANDTSTSQGLESAPYRYFHFSIGAQAPVGEFNEPTGVAVASDGSIYVVDADNCRVQHFGPTGSFITAWGKCGSGDGQFWYPEDVTVAPDGTVYVADSGNDRIQRFSATGDYLGQWGAAGSDNGQFNAPQSIASAPDGTLYVADTLNQRIQHFSATGDYLEQWGSGGTGAGQFNVPQGVTVAPDGTVYVADSWNDRIQYFSATGTYLGQWGTSGSGNGQFYAPLGVTVAPDGTVYVADTSHDRIQHFSATGDYLEQWGTWGGGNGQFINPKRLAVAPNGTVYVADSGNNRIQHFSATGDYLREWGVCGSGDGQLWYPEDVTVTSEGTVYVADTSNHRIQHFSAGGSYLGQWGTEGSGDGQFSSPEGVAVASDGTVYVVDRENDRIQHFSATGSYLGQWGTEGIDNGQFRGPVGITSSSDETVYVADSGNHRIQRFSATGGYLGQWGTLGSSDEQFSSPEGVGVAPGGTVYVADTSNHRIQRFSATGGYLGQWGTEGSGDGQFSSPDDVAVASDGTVYVTDSGNDRIQHFSATGTYLGQWGMGGSGDGQFNDPTGVAVGIDGTVYVVDSSNRVQAFGNTNPDTWRGEYFGNRWLAERPLLVETPASLALDWGSGSPGGTVPADGFGSRWQRYVDFVDSGTYAFTLTVNDGGRLWVDDCLLIEEWRHPQSATFSATLDLEAGYHRLRVEHYDAGGPAALSLSWALQPPAAPTLDPIANADGDGNYTISWNVISNTISYTLQEATSSTFSDAATLYTGSDTQVVVTDHPPGTYYYRVRAANAAGGGAWSNVRTVTVLSDPYEPDDTCAAASAIATDGTEVQHHSFHDSGDADWVTFNATAGTTYIIQGSQVGPEVSLIPELHNGCAQPALPGDDLDFGRGFRLVWECPTTGSYFLKVTNQEGSVYGADATYALTIRTQSPGGVAVVVAGQRDVPERALPNFTYSANMAYRILLAGGYDHDRIYYLHPDLTTDADGDGVPDVDATSSSAHLEQAITEWAAARVGSNTPFYLYMVDHGGDDQIYLNTWTDSVSATELDSWLVELEEAGCAVNVILEACESGSFIVPPESLSSSGRVVISSARAGQTAYGPPGGLGAYFSNTFLPQLAGGADLWTAYATGRDALWDLRDVLNYQQPWLDDNGDGVADALDGDVARQRGLLSAFGSAVPWIATVSPPQQIDAYTAVITATIYDEGALDEVWAEVYPPSYQPPSDPYTVQVIDVPQIRLTQVGAQTYRGSYGGFTEIGEYQVVLYARDDDQQHAVPRVTTVRTGWEIYLPLVLKGSGAVPGS